MLIVPLLLTPIAFVGGLWLAAKFAPPLAETTTGWVAGRVVDLLVGAAAAVIALHVFLAIRVITEDVIEGFGVADALAGQLVDALFQGGLLLGAAAAVHLLAPPPATDD